MSDLESRESASQNDQVSNRATDGTDVVVGAFSHFVWRHRLLWLIGVAVFMIVFDQATKVWAQTSLAEKRTQFVQENVDGEMVKVERERFVHRRSIDIVPNALSFIYRENDAAAFSLTKSIPVGARRVFLIVVSSFAMLLLLVWYFRIVNRPDGPLMTALALIVGGALGNYMDRIRLGYVIDFINMYAGFINPRWPPWPTYNVADSCIVIGAFLVIYRTFRPLYPVDDAVELSSSKPDSASA